MIMNCDFPNRLFGGEGRQSKEDDTIRHEQDKGSVFKV